MTSRHLAQERAKTDHPALARSNITACIRCRQKKKRCDQRLPKCTLCESTGAECVGYDAVAQRQVPRSYVHSLEERVAYLELQLQQHGIAEHDPVSNHDTTSLVPLLGAGRSSGAQGLYHGGGDNSAMLCDSGPEVAAADTADRVKRLQNRKAQDEPAFSQILLRELMSLEQKPSINEPSDASTARQFPLDIINDPDISPVSLPARETALRLVKAYFQFANLSLPLLHEPTFAQRLDYLYAMPGPVDLIQTHTNTQSRVAVFFVFEVFAVALLTIQKQDPSRIPTSLADRYHRTALKALNEVGLQPDVEGVQALLLVGQYCYHHPTVWAVWKTVGAALRLAVELGLHKDMSTDETDPLTLDTMRRTFWVAYAMDRNISIALSMPSCLSDGAITAKFPTEVGDEYISTNGILAQDESAFRTKSISTHVFRYRQIQSEMHTALYERPFPACPSIDFSQWQQNMRLRIQEWYRNIPQHPEITNRERRILENFELTFHRALFYLFHPSPNIPEPPEASLLAMTDAATRMIQLYRQYFCDHRLTIYWQAVENLSSAGTALMFSYVASSRVRERLTLRSLESLVRTCSSVLWGMVEHFPDFQGKRDAFDLTVSKVFDDLNRSSLASEHNEKGNDHLSNSISAEPAVSYSPSVFSLSGQSQLGVNPAAQGLFAIGGQGEHQQLMTETTEPSEYTPHVPVSFSDFNDIAFDWDAFERATELQIPAWT